MAGSSSTRIKATYLVETPLPLHQAAAALAGEQSSGTFVKVPGETPELLERYAARVENIRQLGRTRVASLPGCVGHGGSFKRAEVVVSWSMENMGHNLPTLI